MAFFGFSKKGQSLQTTEPEQTNENQYERRIKLVGCDEINPDGSSRQDILWQIAEKVRPYDRPLDLSIEEFDSNGQKGYYIKVSDKIIGQAGAKAAVWISQYSQRITGISDFKVTGGEKRIINDKAKIINNRFTSYTATIKIAVKQ